MFSAESQRNSERSTRGKFRSHYGIFMKIEIVYKYFLLIIFSYSIKKLAVGKRLLCLLLLVISNFVFINLLKNTHSLLELGFQESYILFQDNVAGWMFSSSTYNIR